MKVLFVLLFTILSPTSSINIECNYDLRDFYIIGSSYTCHVKINTYIISPDSVDIFSAKGIHKNEKNDHSVVAIKADNSKFLYFPHGLKKIFRRLKFIWINTCELKEVHQTDLMIYPDLELLQLGGNPIVVLEEDLFKYNPDLKLFSCWYCNIFHVDAKVFDNLSKLVDIWLVVNPCIDKKSDGTSVSVNDMIGAIKDKCVSPSFLMLKQKFDDFEEVHRNLSSEKFNQKFEMLEKELKTSKFYNFPSLKKKIEEFKNQNIQNTCKIDKLETNSFKSEGMTALNMKINDIESDLKVSMIDTSRNVEYLVKNLQTSHEEELTALKDKIEDLRSSNENMARKIDKMSNKLEKLTEVLEKIDEKVNKFVQH
ncbi:hypothetical protein ACKWTF_001555 [Chironomus riparius]